MYFKLRTYTLDGSIDLFKLPHSKCRRFNLKEFWECRESNPELLSEKRECCLCAMALPLPPHYSFFFAPISQSTNELKVFCETRPDLEFLILKSRLRATNWIKGIFSIGIQRFQRKHAPGFEIEKPLWSSEPRLKFQISEHNFEIKASFLPIWVAFTVINSKKAQLLPKVIKKKIIFQKKRSNLYFNDVV